MKTDKTNLRRDAWRAENVWWRPKRGDLLRQVTLDDIATQAHLLP